MISIDDNQYTNKHIDILGSHRSGGWRFSRLLWGLHESVSKGLSSPSWIIEVRVCRMSHGQKRREREKGGGSSWICECYGGLGFRLCTLRVRPLRPLGLDAVLHFTPQNADTWKVEMTLSWICERELHFLMVKRRRGSFCNNNYYFFIFFIFHPMMILWFFV